MKRCVDTFARYRPAAWALLLAAACAGCGGGGGRYDVTQRLSDGPVSMVFEVRGTDITTAELVEARLRVTAPVDIAVAMPGPEANFGKLTLLDYVTPEEAPAQNGQKTWEENYVLEPGLAGEYELPPLQVLYRGQSDRATPKSLMTEAAPIKVVSIFKDETETPELLDIAPPASWPVSKWRWLAPLLALTACLIIGAGLITRRRLRAAAPAVSAGPSPFEVAWNELEALLGENLPAKGELDMFYVRLTGILRRYIDGRFGIHAPKQTTEEVLGIVRGNGKLKPAEQDILADFLACGDLVKFAGWRPAASVADESAEHCRAFLRATEPAGEGR